MNPDRHNLLKPWIAAILWLIVIAIESSALLSAHNTGQILYPLFHYLFGLDWERFEYWHFYIRKGGHVVGYAILSILLFRAWRATLPAMSAVKWTPRWASIAILGTALVASLDEWHQSFIPSRLSLIHIWPLLVTTPQPRFHYPPYSAFPLNRSRKTTVTWLAGTHERSALRRSICLIPCASLE